MAPRQDEPAMKLSYIGIDLLYPALPALYEAGCEIAEIFTCKTDNYTEFNLKVCGFARERGIPLTIGRIDRTTLERLCGIGCEAVVCAGYYHRLPIDRRLKMVNVHPSLLPVGRGAWPMPVTLLKGITKSGITVHKLTEAYDAGDILMQEAIEVLERDNLQTLTARLQGLLPGMMQKLAVDFDRYYHNAVPQGKGEIWPCPAEDSIPITPDMPLAKADRILRAFYGYECVYVAGEERYGLIGGAIGAAGGAFPVQGGFIRAKKIRRL
jgi:methionyl-tRNA formyltransferase